MCSLHRHAIALRGQGWVRPPSILQGNGGQMRHHLTASLKQPSSHDASLRKGAGQESTSLHEPMWDHSVTKLEKFIVGYCRYYRCELLWVLLFSLVVFMLLQWCWGWMCIYLIFKNSHGIYEILSDNKLGYCYSVWTGIRVIEAGLNRIQESSPLQDAGEALDVARWERCSMCPIPRDPERSRSSWSQQHRISCILWAC